MSRLASGGRIDRTRPVRFTFNGTPYRGYEGDTLASALLANDVRVVAKSVIYRRPRGIFTAGIEEPNALVQVGEETMLRATQVELVDGLEAMGLNGRGRLSAEPDTGRYDKMFAHCEVLVVGGGRAGITAALEASQTGDRVILVDEQAELGGRLLGATWTDWLETGLAALRSRPDVRLLTRATAFGQYDRNLVLIAQRRPGGGRLWQVRAKRVVIATGAHERPLIFANNDRPGIVLAAAARTYINRYGVAPGKRAVIFTNNDSTAAVAADLQRAGISIEAVADVRAGEAVLDTRGDDEDLHSVLIGTLRGTHSRREIDCDLLCVSGGFNPTLHLFSQAQGRLRYDEGLACFVPDGALPNVEVVGAAAGDLGGRGQGTVMPYWVVPGDGLPPAIRAGGVRLDGGPKSRRSLRTDSCHRHSSLARRTRRPLRERRPVEATLVFPAPG
jgi:sarcosine oxidase subunit alpha